MLAAGRGARFGGDTPKPLLVLARPAARRARDRRPRVGSASRRCSSSWPTTRRRGRGVAPRRTSRSSATSAGRRHRVEPAGRAACRSSPRRRRRGRGRARRPAARRRGGVPPGRRARTMTAPGSRSRPMAASVAIRCCSAAVYWAEALALRGDEGARVLLRRTVPSSGVRRHGDPDRRRHARRPRERSMERTTLSGHRSQTASE